MKANPCSKCYSSMETRSAQACSATGDVYTCHFLVCVHCGHGPNQAFDTPAEAVAHWNYHSRLLEATRTPEFNFFDPDLNFAT